MTLRRRGYSGKATGRKIDPKDTPQNIGDVNRYLKQKGYGDYIFRSGRSYYYVGLKKDNKVGKLGDPNEWAEYVQVSVYTYRANQMTYKEWLSRFLDIAKEGKLSVERGYEGFQMTLRHRGYLVERRGARKPRRDRRYQRVDDRSSLEQKNKQMNDEVYKLRRTAMEYVYRAKKLLRTQLGAEMPRVTVRITELTNKESRMVASARMGKNIVWVTEDAINELPDSLHEIVFHELAHAIFNQDHVNSCPLMKALTSKKPLSSSRLDELFLKHAKKFYRKVTK
jgi:hypothetical protein